MTAHHDLESRYRRLMAVYPGWHRREYEEEMVGVLLAGARPGQRRPGLRDQADLIVSALAVRVRGAAGGSRDGAWRRAAYTAQVIGMLVLLGVGVRRLILAYPMFSLQAIDVARPVGWALALAATLIGMRRTACALTVLLAVAEVGRVAAWYSESPSRVLTIGWLVAIAILVALSSVWLAGRGPLPRPRGLWWFGAALAAGTAASVVDAVQGESYLFGTWGWGVTMDGSLLFRFSAPLYLLAAAAAVRGWWRLDGPVRRRLLTFAAPVTATAVLVTYGFAGFMYSSQQFASPVLLAPLQWVILGLTPVAAFALALVVLNRWERLTGLIALGRRTEAERPRAD